MGKIEFDIAKEAKEYKEDIEKLGYPDDLYEIDSEDIERAFIAGAQWAFDMIDKHCKGAYLIGIQDKVEENSK